MFQTSESTSSSVHLVRCSLRYLSAVQKKIKNYKNMAAKLQLHNNIVELLYDLYRTADS